MPPYAAGSGGPVSSRAAAAWCERSHECPAEGRRAALDGGVTGSRALKGRSKCSRNMFPIIVYAFTAHNQRVAHRRVRNGRPRQAARSVAVPSPAAASTGLSVRRRASTEHLGSAPGGPSQPPCPACTPSRPKFRENAASVAPWLRSPAKLLSLRWATILAGQHCVHQSTNITFPRRLTAPRSMAGGSLVDPRPSRASSVMGRRPSAGS